MQLGHLIKTMPDLKEKVPFRPETHIWLGRAAALIELVCDPLEYAEFRKAVDWLGVMNRDQQIQIITKVLYRALARAEILAPITASGAFVPVGEPFAAFTAVSKIIGNASNRVLIVDPYADEKVLTDYAVLAPEGVEIGILGDLASVKPSLKPAMANWLKQYATTRPLEVRLTPARALHDRLIFVDNKEAWMLTQSLKDFAARSPATIARVDAETAGLKVVAYQQIWHSATPI